MSEPLEGYTAQEVGDMGQASHTMYTSVGGSPPQRPTPTECVANGGHCWEGDPVSLQQRICKHCGLRQRGVRQDAIAWEAVTDG